MSRNIITEQDAESENGNYFLVNLTYISQVSQKMDANTLKDILSTAQTNNKAYGISGILLFNRQFFLQTIEGSRPRINQLLTNLINDQRHTELRIVDSLQLSQRQWDKWSMAYATPSEKNQTFYLKYSTTKAFNPYIMSAESIHQLLNELGNSSMKPAEEEPPNQAVKKGFFQKMVNHWS